MIFPGMAADVESVFEGVVVALLGNLQMALKMIAFVIPLALAFSMHCFSHASAMLFRLMSGRASKRDAAATDAATNAIRTNRCSE
eukprot:CAMPEP_0195036426 /NCGR_PEP_ID=MMETSP0326_2-20130528/72527_1 /TAXON_ID=2866 ORGANISM="Crypthecodinium cohnii, Strain Seligo" /NCGR_SAMPLE_ID=MMETSP0326_2 /ASSEMBLY_ACC=CAM_ASM_000348 /LENGTH=84 /DNA_ID=CAMNT_0040062043 /DNA_START=38 /DNA_END=290 /DNA_ORIENTATION=-